MPRYIEQLNECADPAIDDWVWIVDTSAAAGDKDRKLSLSRLARLGQQNEGPLLLGPGSGPSTALVIANGVITVTGNYHLIDTEAAAAADDLTTINGGTTGQLLILRSTSSARDVTLKNGAGNLTLGADITLNGSGDLVVLFFTGSAWMRLAHADN